VERLGSREGQAFHHTLKRLADPVGTKGPVSTQPTTTPKTVLAITCLDGWRQTRYTCAKQFAVPRLIEASGPTPRRLLDRTQRLGVCPLLLVDDTVTK
jgi:hypothetical protein